MSEARPDDARVPQLDGWRAISICLVLAAHLFPLGPSRFRLNFATGKMGMALFFILSGYLITAFLLHRPDVKAFLIRRLLRILPLAWGGLLLLLPLTGGPPDKIAARFLFYQNYYMSAITPYTSHYWSLCVEMHFYLGVAVLVLLGGRRALWVLPLALVGMTAVRFVLNMDSGIPTHRRIDEILAGATLALLTRGARSENLLRVFQRVSPWVGIVAFTLTSLPQTEAVTFLRPYAGALLVGSTLYQPQHWLSRCLGWSVLRYIATVSYAVYVVHGPLRIGWFDEGSNAVRYLIKRPLTLALTFLLAHLSTFFWEARFIELARRLTKPKDAPSPDGSAARAVR